MKRKRWVIGLCVLCMLVALCACGEKNEAVEQVERLISAVGIDVTPEDGGAIEAAEAAYEALSPEEQAQVHNYPVLVSARALYDFSLVREEYLTEARQYNDCVERYNATVRDYNDALEELNAETADFTAFLDRIEASGIYGETAYEEDVLETLREMTDDARSRLTAAAEPLEEKELLGEESAGVTVEELRAQIDAMGPDSAAVVEETVALSAELEDLRQTDYSEVQEAIQTQWDLAGTSVAIERQVTQPEDSFLTDRLSYLWEDITAVEFVTRSNDPEGHLGQNGWYTSALYFTLSVLDADPEDSPVALGVTGGGAIEVYATAEDAASRAQALQRTETTTVLGTLVIRTSENLTAAEQTGIVNKIIYVLTYYAEEQG